VTLLILSQFLDNLSKIPKHLAINLHPLIHDSFLYSRIDVFSAFYLILPKLVKFPNYKHRM
jgi:hypothetical protein